ncbi:MAG: CBS domain-containing protein [ANME-2 cluster archaeon]|nr:CBS domain-containing protein [ANME-2 cluster archaeon]
MQIKEIMTTNVISCSPDEPVKHAAQLLREHKISGIPVVEDGKVVGMVTGSDILRLLEVPEKDSQLWLPSPFEIIEVPLRELISWEEAKHALEDVGAKSLADVMSSPVVTANASDSLETVASRMVKHNINRVPILENGELVGIVTRQDIMAGLALSA